jgi:hypothetical protein
MADVVSLARKAERLTADPAAVAEKTGEGLQIRSLIGSLIDAVIHLPRSAKSLQGRLARAEAENVRLACHRVEWADREVDKPEIRRIELAIQELDIALVRFSILAR